MCFGLKFVKINCSKIKIKCNILQIKKPVRAHNKYAGKPTLFKIYTKVSTLQKSFVI